MPAAQSGQAGGENCSLQDNLSVQIAVGVIMIFIYVFLPPFYSLEENCWRGARKALVAVTSGTEVEGLLFLCVCFNVQSCLSLN